LVATYPNAKEHVASESGHRMKAGRWVTIGAAVMSLLIGCGTSPTAPRTRTLTGTVYVHDSQMIIRLAGLSGAAAGGFGDAAAGAAANQVLDGLDAHKVVPCSKGVLSPVFDDLHGATPVEVDDESNKTIALTQLDSGVVLAQIRGSTETRQGCAFTFSTPVPSATFYKVKVAAREGATFTAAQMDAAHWRVDLTINE
jgi:hypothetical protein